MKVGAFNPYLHTRGGGERYFLEVASVLARRHEVDVLVPPGKAKPGLVRDDLAAMFGLDLSGLRFVPARSGVGDDDYSTLTGYDAALTVTNIHPPIRVPRPHVSILQFPWNVTRRSQTHRWKAGFAISRCDQVLVYSPYVREWVMRIPMGHAAVVPPGVQSISADAGPRERVILAVGRFASGGHNKKQDVLIEAFRRLSAQLTGWRLVLAGAAGQGDSDYVDMLRREAQGLDVDFKVNVSREELEWLYRRATFFWHAAGYGEDLVRHPALMEHFGIVAVEAMSAGCLPLVFHGGGLPEVVEYGRSGLTWTSIPDLVASTTRLVHEPGEYETLVDHAKLRAREFSRERFEERLIGALPSSLWAD